MVKTIVCKTCGNKLVLRYHVDDTTDYHIEQDKAGYYFKEINSRLNGSTTVHCSKDNTHTIDESTAEEITVAHQENGIDE